MPIENHPTGKPAPVLPDKPLMRGWFHAAMTPVVLVAGLWLAWRAPSSELRTACLIYMACGLIMFGNSALYHRFYRRTYWSPGVKSTFRRLDHAFIFVFIAGTYTPLSVALLHGGSRIALLSVVWGLAVLGMLFRIFWLGAPRWLYTALYVVLGWAAVWWMPQLWHAGGPGVIIWLVVGGVIYTLGAVVYGLKRPDPWPDVFGFHEIFHLATVLAAIAHFVAILLALRAAG